MFISVVLLLLIIGTIILLPINENETEDDVKIDENDYFSVKAVKTPKKEYKINSDSFDRGDFLLTKF